MLLSLQYSIAKRTRGLFPSLGTDMKITSLKSNQKNYNTKSGNYQYKVFIRGEGVTICGTYIKRDNVMIQFFTKIDKNTLKM